MKSEVTGRKSLGNALVGLVLVCLGALLPAGGAWAAAQYCPAPNLQVTLDTGYCELCGGGRVQLRITNSTSDNPVGLPSNSQNVTSGSRTFSDVELVVDLQQVAGVYNTSGHSAGFQGASGSQLRWDLGDINRTGSRVVSFDLNERDMDQEKLIAISRQIRTAVEFEYGNCEGGQFRTRTGGGWGNPTWDYYSYGGAPYQEGPFYNNFTLDVREPRPGIAKAGRNVDAGMPRGTFSTDPDLAGNTIFGHEDDGIIWRVTIDNYNGNQPMYDVIFDDSMVPSPTGNMDVLAVCRIEADAEAVAEGGSPSAGSCTAITGDELIGRHLANDFGFPLPINPGSARQVYIAGTLRNSCVDQVNIANGVEWGCLALNNVTPVDGIAGISQSILGNYPSYGAGNRSILEVSSSPNLVRGLGSASNFNNTSTLNYDVTFTGLNPNEPVGMRGLVTITIENRTGGTVNQVELTNTLPDQYILDPNFEPQFTISSFGNAYQNYRGRVAGIDWRNRVTPSANQSSYLNNPALKAPNFYLSSVGNTLDETANGVAEQEDLLRHGDVVTITFRIVQVNQDGSLTYYDRMADLDENNESLQPGTLDPQVMPALTNTLRVQWGDFCDSNTNGANRSNQVVTQSFTPNPENLNVDIPEPLYIIRDTGPTSVSAYIHNSGGHTATDYLFYVTFGNGLLVTPPAACTTTANPPQHPDAGIGQVPLWNTPPSDGVANHNADGNPLPDGAFVFRCDVGAIAPGQQRELAFAVEKNHGAAYDDITMRADVVGEVRLANNSDRNNPQSVGDALVFPTPANLNGPIQGTTPSQQLANNYSLDAARARALGFNLLKRYVPGTCKEGGTRTSGDGNGRDTPPQILVGEDCDFEIFAGGWFGFKTPGWDITVDNIDVADATPSHSGGDDPNTGRQGFISETRLACNASGLNILSPDSVCDQIISPLGFTPGSPLSEENLLWDFGSTPITKRNYWFLASVTSRLLNNPVDQVANPNLHNNLSVDYGRTSFRVTYESEKTAGGVPETIFDEVIANDGSGGQPACFKQGNDWNPLATNSCNSTYPGYPQWPDWTAQLQITEPKLHILKEVCNFSRAGENLDSCDWQDEEVDGSRFDDFIYRLTVNNEQEAGPAAAPAYDVVITDVLQSSQMCVWPFNRDGVDNTPDGDVGLVGINNVGASNYQYDPDSPDADIHCRENGDPAFITFSYEQSPALKRIDAGSSVQLLYRVSPHRTVVPNQTFDNTAAIFRYDSLFELAGNQSSPRIENGNHPGSDGVVPPRTVPESQWPGGARIYCSNGEEGDSTDHCGTDGATMRIIGVDAEPKAVIQTSTNNAAVATDADLASGPVFGDGASVDVVVGEEVTFRLIGTVPASRLRDLTFEDDLPPGLSCIEAAAVDLTQLDTSATWFTGSGPTTPAVTCEGNRVEWRYGDQFLQDYDPSKYPEYDGLFPIVLTFIARVDNSADTAHGAVLTNPASTGVAQMTYRDSAGNLQEPAVFSPISLNVLGPRIVLTKEFSVVEADAGDILTVTVTATNMENEDGPSTADAYNLRVLDDLVDSRYTYIGNIGGIDPPDDDNDGVNTNAPIFSWNRDNSDYAIAPGESRSFTFQVRVNQDVEPHEVMPNTIQARWQSLPGSDVALNAAGLIGSDGDIDGMRIGALPNTNDLINDYETIADAQVEVPVLTFAKADLDDTVVPTIGAHKQFQLEITLPDGISNNVRITDRLAAGGTSYVLTRDANYDIRCTYVGIEQINGAAPVDGACNFNVVPAADATGDVVWDIGTVDTVSEDDTGATPVTPTITITYFARIDNEIAETQNGDSLRNDATLNYSNGETGAEEALTDTTAAITAVEPDLEILKAVTNTTGSAGLAQGGDVLEYVLTIRHTGASTVDAFDLNVLDILPPEVRFESSFAPTATVNGSAVAGFVAVPATPASNQLVWGRENGDNGLDLPLGQTLEITYRANVVSVFGQPVMNEAYVDWTSLNDDVIGQDIYQRHGLGCPTFTDPNNYCSGPAQAAINTEDNSGLQKRVVSDSYGDPADSTVRVGDTVTYRLELNVQPGTTNNVVVTDTMDTGLVLESFSIDAAAGGYVFTPVSQPAAGDTSLTWSLGDVTRELGTAAPLIIEYVARVTEDSGIPHVASTALNNTANLTYTDGSGNPPTDPAVLARLESTATVTVLQPVIDDLTKVDRGGRTSPDLITDLANTVMVFSLQACNSGAAPAYGMQLTDDLAWEMDETSIQNVEVSIDGAALADSDYTYTPAAGRDGNMVFELNVPVDPGLCVMVNYDIGFHTDVGGDRNWQNSFVIDEYWSLPPADAQKYAPVTLPAPYLMSTAPVSVDPLQKLLLAPTDGTAAVGEEVVYQLLVPATNTSSAIYDVSISDVLDPSLEIISIQERGGLPVTDNSSGNNIALALNLLPAGSRAQIEIRARVANNATAQEGHNFDNVASFTYAETDGGTQIDGGAGTADTLTVIEPQLSASKIVANQTAPGAEPAAGDVLRFTLNLTEAGIANNSADAFDLLLQEQLSLGLEFVPGSATFAGAAIVDPVVSGDGQTTAQALRWDVATANLDIAFGTSASLVFDVRVLESVLAGADLSAVSRVEWTSLDDDNSSVYERNGSGGLNDYFIAGTTAALLTANTTTLEKRHVGDSYNAADKQLRVGDLVEFELRVNLQEGTHPNAAVTDTLPQGMVFERTISINGDTTAPFAAAAPFSHNEVAEPVQSGNPVAGPTTVSWPLDGLINQGDNDAANDVFVIHYLARVLNQDAHPWPANSTPLTNNAEYVFETAAGSASVTATETLELLQPDVALTIAGTAANGDAILEPNELVEFTVTLTNNGSAPAYDLTLRDQIPVGLRQAGVVVESTAINGSGIASVTPVYDAATGEVRWDFAGSAYAIPVGGVLEMTYRLQADANIGAGLAIENGAYVEVYYSLAADALPMLAGVNVAEEMREDYGPTAPQGVVFSTPSAVDLDIANTQDYASIGEPFRYRVTIPATTQAAALNDVQVVIDLPDTAELVFVSAEKVSGSANFVPVNTGTGNQLIIEDTTNGIDVPANEQAVVDVVVRLRDVNPPNADGQVFNTSATYRYNFVNDDPASGQGAGGGNTTADMTVVEPTELVMTKSMANGATTIQSGMPGRFLLDVHNRGTGPAWDLTVRDFLPNTDQGGLCATPPANFAATILDAGGNVVAALSQGSDFTAAFDADACTLTFGTVGAAAKVAADHHVQFAYDAYLDVDTVDGTALDNVAGAERWYSWDSTGPDARIYERAYAANPPDGTPSVEDHEDVFTVTAAVPSVLFEKVVENITTGVSPATTATPGDLLQYTVTLRNLSDLDVENVSVIDELDRLNAPAFFAPGTLQLIAAPVGADTAATSATGGANGSGLVDVRNLILGGAGSGTEEIQLVYQVQLVDVIDNATAVLNQAQVQLPGQALINSDDPNINGAADPQVAGDEDPTRVIIESAPVLKVEKISEDLTGEPDSLMPGDTLRYTLRVENIGNENMLEASLRDQVPANTTYVAGSTTLNGAALDDVNGSTPLTQTLAIQSPGAETGELLADPNAVGTRAAVITFDVTINNVNDGTVISNQGFANGVGAGGENTPVDEKPSDDPTTEVADDPTIDIVGNVPLIRAQKTVELVVDNVTAGIVDPEDVLRYTITVSNMGGKDATEARFVDLVPEYTTYVAGSTLLNGIAVADNGVDSPLVTGIPISSDDLTPPLPAEGEGVITTTQTATIVFDVMVNADTERGTVISNQGNVYSLELPLTLTDADGNSSNGAQPTEVVVGDAQQLSITKEVAVVGDGAAESGKVLEYIVRVTNISAVPASLVTIYDDLLVAGEGVLTYVEDSARLNGQADGVMVDGPLITVDYSTNYGDLQPSESITLRFEARLGENLAMGYSVVNTAQVKWNDPPVYNEATVAIDIGGTPGIANLSGYLWHDVNFSETADSEEQLLTNWSVSLYFNNALLETVQSDENGYFVFDGLVPNMDGANAGGATYELRYLAPNAVESTASLGTASSDYTNGPQQIRDVYVGSGANPQNLNLPITPNGVIYDSVLRAPVNGARVRMLGASSGQPLPDSCFEDPAQQNQVTVTGGFYKFDVNFSSAACAVNADYLIEVDVPSEDYVSGPSQIIPPQTGIDTGSFDVAACLGSAADVIPGTPDHCEVQLSVLPPPVDLDARSAETNYYLRVNLDDSNQPGSSQLFNNHIALDPQLEGALALTKTAAMLNVTRSQLVPYTITFSNSLPVPLTDLQLVDYFPAGFKYVAGSANLDGMPVEPEVNGLQLQWPSLRAEPEQTHSMKLLLVVGSGVGEGEYVNRARMFNELSGQQTSGEAMATVRVVPDPTFDCTDVIGKVFDDKNLNGYQDSGEGGVPGARVVTANGLKATADAHGRFHITCAAVPNPDRGSNFVLKLDDRSLPSGYRLTTENPRVQRATRGKMLEFNFGTSLHRVVRLDLAEAVFEPGTSELRPQWQSRTELLLERLQEAPSVLRLSYLAENEDPSLVDARLETIKARIAGDWAALDCCYPLNIETEIFWRRGAPPERGNVLDGLKRSVNRMIGSDDQGGAR